MTSLGLWPSPALSSQPRGGDWPAVTSSWPRPLEPCGPWEANAWHRHKPESACSYPPATSFLAWLLVCDVTASWQRLFGIYGSHLLAASRLRLSGGDLGVGHRWRRPHILSATATWKLPLLGGSPCGIGLKPRSPHNSLAEGARHCFLASALAGDIRGALRWQLLSCGLHMESTLTGDILGSSADATWPMWLQ